MYIERIINGETVKFELDANEVRQAYDELDYDYTRNDIVEYIRSNPHLFDNAEYTQQEALGDSELLDNITDRFIQREDCDISYWDNIWGAILYCIEKQ